MRWAGDPKGGYWPARSGNEQQKEPADTGCGTKMKTVRRVSARPLQVRHASRKSPPEVGYAVLGRTHKLEGMITPHPKPQGNMLLPESRQQAKQFPNSSVQLKRRWPRQEGTSVREQTLCHCAQ